MRLMKDILWALGGIILVMVIGFSIPLTEEENDALTAKAFDLPWVWR